jgi:hypothetical protein
VSEQLGGEHGILLVRWILVGGEQDDTEQLRTRTFTCPGEERAQQGRIEALGEVGRGGEEFARALAEGRRAAAVLVG